MEWVIVGFLVYSSFIQRHQVRTFQPLTLSSSQTRYTFFVVVLMVMNLENKIWRNNHLQNCKFERKNIQSCPTQLNPIEPNSVHLPTKSNLARSLSFSIEPNRRSILWLMDVDWFVFWILGFDWCCVLICVYVYLLWWNPDTSKNKKKQLL
jgi:hypothetical protein